MGSEMPKIVIIGSCRLGPYEILAMPNLSDAERQLYQKDQEKGYEHGCKKFYPAIDQCDEVWIYIPNGTIGEHTMRDLLYALDKKKTVRIIGGVNK